MPNCPAESIIKGVVVGSLGAANTSREERGLRSRSSDPDGIAAIEDTRVANVDIEIAATQNAGSCSIPDGDVAESGGVFCSADEPLAVFSLPLVLLYNAPTPVATL